MKIVEKSVHPGFSQNEKRQICYEIAKLQQKTKLKVSQLVKMMGEKYHFKSYMEIYRWNRNFNYVFKLDTLTPEEKKEICIEVKNLKEQGKIPLEEIVKTVAAKHNINVFNIHSWNRKYNIFNIGFTDDERKQICQEVKELKEKGEMPVKDILESVIKKYGIKDKTTLYQWNNKFHIFSVDMLTNDDRRKICEQVRDLQMSTNMKLSDILKEVAEKYNYKSYGDIYVWNKEFGYIFEILTDEKRKEICYEVQAISQTSDLKLPEILKITAKKYNIQDFHNIYIWNQKFGYIFDLYILSKDDRKKVCEEIKENLKTGQKYKDVIEYISKKYKVQKATVIGWNREFDDIFDLYLTDEEKIAILEDLKELMERKKISTAVATVQIAKKYSCTETCIYRWNRKFEICTTLRKFNETEKIAILTEIKNAITDPEFTGSVILEYAKKYGITRNTIYYWNTKYNKIINTKSMENRKNLVYPEKFIFMVLAEFETIQFTRENIKIVAEKHNIKEANIYRWNRKYKRFNTLLFKKGANERLRKEVEIKLEKDKDFNEKVSQNIRQKSK